MFEPWIGHSPWQELTLGQARVLHSPVIAASRVSAAIRSIPCLHMIYAACTATISRRLGLLGDSLASPRGC